VLAEFDIAPANARATLARLTHRGCSSAPRRAGGPATGWLTARAAVAATRPYLDAEQWNRLRAVFFGGVCDWSKPGVGQVPLAGTWVRF
jgi:hypothetical protein